MTGEPLAFPWARTYDADQLAAFIEDLWGAAGGDNDLVTLDAIENVIAEHRPDRAVHDGQPCPISSDQVRLLEQLANGAGRTQAAEHVGVKASAVRMVLSRAYDRLGAKNAIQAVAIAIRMGWLSTEAIQPPAHRSKPWRWQDRRPQQWVAEYQAHAAKLRAQPGDWLPVGPYKTRSIAERAALRIRKGLVDAYRPAGGFQAEAFLDEREWFVRARFVDSTSTTTPESTS